MSIDSLVTSGPLLLAIPVAAAAGAVTFLSPCCLPLVPGYLSYITGMSGAGTGTATAGAAKPSMAEAGTAEARAIQAAMGATATGTTATATAVLTDDPAAGAGDTVTAGDTATAGDTLTGGDRATAGDRAQTRAVPATPLAPAKGRAVAGTALFVLGFSFVFATYGFAIGGIGQLLRTHDTGLTQVLGGITILLGLLFAGAFDRFSFAGRIFKPSARPQAGLAGAPLLGVMFGFGWSPCLGPTLSAVLALGASSGTAGRGAFLAFVYGLGLGIPFLIVALAFQRMVNVLGFFRRNARTVSRVGGALLVIVGLLEVTGAWSSAIVWIRAHWIQGYNLPL